MFPIRLVPVIVAGVWLWVAVPAYGEDSRAGKYPEAPHSGTVDVYHGTKVADRFRPLEDPDAPATRAWIEAENRQTFAFLESIPERAAIKRRLTELSDFEKYEPPIREGGRYFFAYNKGLQNQSVLYTTAIARWRGERRDRPERAFAGRDGRAGGDQGQPGRTIRGVWDRRGRLGLERLEGSRPGYGKGPARCDQVDQVLRGRVGAGQPGLLLRAVPRAQGRRGPEGRELRPEGLLSPAGHATAWTMCWSGKIRSTRSGERARPSPTTEAT